MSDEIILNETEQRILATQAASVSFMAKGGVPSEVKRWERITKAIREGMTIRFSQAPPAPRVSAFVEAEMYLAAHPDED